MPEIERDGEELPRLSPGVGCDSTAQGDKVIHVSKVNYINNNYDGSKSHVQHTHTHARAHTHMYTHTHIIYVLRISTDTFIYIT